jgi:hypothetical protein
MADYMSAACNLRCQYHVVHDQTGLNGNFPQRYNLICNLVHPHHAHVYVSFWEHNRCLVLIAF